MKKATCHQLFNLHRVRLISGINFMEKNTQAQLTVIIHLGDHNSNKATFPQFCMISLNSVRLISGVKVLVKNTQAQLTVATHLGHSTQTRRHVISSSDYTLRSKTIQATKGFSRLPIVPDNTNKAIFP